MAIFRQDKTEITNTLSWVAFLLIVFFMITNWSEVIWQSSPSLLRIQRSSRLFGLFYFGGAALCAITVKGMLQLKWQWRIFPLIILLSILLTNFHYGYKLTRQSPGLHSPTKGTVFIREWMETAFYEPYSDKLIDVPEYRPLLKNATYSPTIRERYSDSGKPYIEGGTAYFPVPKIGEPKISVVSGEASIDIEKWASYERKFKVTATENSIIRIRTYYYPAWRLYVNQQSYPLTMSEDGTIQFEVRPGSYEGKLLYQSTTSFMVGIALSITSMIDLVILSIKFGF